MPNLDLLIQWRVDGYSREATIDNEITNRLDDLYFDFDDEKVCANKRP